MSNHLAIATVSAALGNITIAAAQAAVAGATLRFGRPASPSNAGERKVHVYLYQVTPNAALRNADLPSRDAEARVTGRPKAALDLHYLITFYGDDDALEPARMAGAVARELHANPVLSRQAIQDATGASGELADSDLVSAAERVRFTPSPLSLDEFSKLWSVLTQTPHALSLAFQASLVVIDGLVAGAAALPVLSRGDDDQISAGTSAPPRLDSIWIGNPTLSERRPLGPSLPVAALGSRLVLNGANLGETIRVRLEHPRKPALVLDATPIPNRKLGFFVDLPDDAPAQTALAAGIYGVTALVGSGASQSTSNLVPLALSPRFVLEPAGPLVRAPDTQAVTVTLRCRPRLVKDQRATLLLAGREASVEVAADSDTVSFEIADAPLLENELLRLRVDGVEGLPFVFDDDTGRFVFDDGQRLSIT